MGHLMVFRSSALPSSFMLALLVLSTESRLAHQPPHIHHPILLKSSASCSGDANTALVQTMCFSTTMLHNRNGKGDQAGSKSADYWRQRVRLASQSVGPSGDGDAESSSTWKWLQEKTQGRTTQFDILLKRSNNRIDMQRQRLELKSRQKEILQLQKTLVHSSEVVDSYKQLVADIQTKIINQKDLQPREDSKEAARVGDLKVQLQEAQQNLAAFQSSVLTAQTQTEQLITELKRSESQLEELRIRTELEAERERQSLRLKAMLDAMSDGPDSYKSLHVLSPLLEQLPLSTKDEPLASPVALRANNKKEAQEEESEAEQAADAKRRAQLQALLKKQLGKAGAVLEDAVVESGVGEEAVTALCRTLREEAGLGNDKIASILHAYTPLLHADLNLEVRPVLGFLLGEARVEREALASVVAAQPSILTLDVEASLKPAMTFLVKEARVPAGKVDKVLQQCPRLLLLRPEEGPRAVVEFLAGDVGLSRDNVGKAVTSFPQVLTMCTETQLGKTLAWLESVGVPAGRLERVVRLHPKTLSYSLNNNLQPTVRYLWEEVGVPPEKLGKMIASFPQLLGLSVQHNLRPMVQYLLDEVGVEPARLHKMFCTLPQLFGLSLQNNIRPHVEYLVTDVGIPRDRIGKAVVTFPHLLAYNRDDKLKPTVHFLLTLGVPKDRIGKLVATHPQILGYSVDEKLVPTVRYLVEDVGVEPHRIGEVVERCPKLLGCSVDNNLRPTVQFLLDEVGIHPTQIGQVVTKYPSLLGLSIDNNLRPKLAYLREEVHVEHEAMRKLLVTCPQLLAYSLENRIKPRHRLLLGKGLKLGLHSMLAPTDIAFYQRYGDGLGRVPAVKAALNVGDAASGRYYWDGEAEAVSRGVVDGAVRGRERARKPQSQTRTTTTRGRKGSGVQRKQRGGDEVQSRGMRSKAA